MTNLEKILYKRLDQVRTMVKPDPKSSASDFVKALNKAYKEVGGCPGCKSETIGVHAGNCPTQDSI